MNRMFASRVTFRAIAAGMGSAACASSLLINRRKIRCDAPSLVSPPRRQRQSLALDLSPETVTQISSGSVTGFGVGLFVSLFSHTLALLAGLIGLSLHIASRSGVDVPRMLGVQKYLDGNELWEKSKGKPWFTASFLATFLLATVVRI